MYYNFSGSDFHSSIADFCNVDNLCNLYYIWQLFVSIGKHRLLDTSKMSLTFMNLS